MEFSFVNFIYINFTATILIVGILLNVVEPYLPTFISQSFRYGKHGHKGKSNSLISMLELPKSYFKHFYAFALFWSLWGLYLVLKGIIISSAVPDGIMQFLDLVAGGNDRPVLVNTTSALIAIVLLSVQCIRRFYETWAVQIFSKKSKINISHYLVGYIHYFGAVIAILANTEGFIKDSLPSSFSLSKIPIHKYIFIALFHIAWKQQYKSNMILVQGRSNKDKKVITENHILPKGGTFEFVSSPHMFYEIIIYIAIWGIIPESKTWMYCLIWVIVNQIQNAWLAHKWYLETFPNYPKHRRAIIPFIL